MHSTEFPRLATVAVSFSAEFAKKASDAVLSQLVSFNTSETKTETSLRGAQSATHVKGAMKENIHAFDGLSSECRKCQKQRVRWTCDACQRELQEHDFDANIFAHARDHNRNRVCTSCCNKGMSPKDVRKYRCDECGDHGHLKFPYEARRTYNE